MIMGGLSCARLSTLSHLVLTTARDMGPVIPAMLMTAWKLTRLHSLPQVTQLILLVRSRTRIYTFV